MKSSCAYTKPARLAASFLGVVSFTLGNSRILKLEFPNLEFPKAKTRIP